MEACKWKSPFIEEEETERSRASYLEGKKERSSREVIPHLELTCPNAQEKIRVVEKAVFFLS